ncbi:hypothetical protein Fcan01_04029 [Folsomia candida]|uniref:Uncharacterized protein n=1 Tax=Folsomia candida TaxID=158441 RepID=A0A226EMJ5_FOLCA|nr:hypothetical protein Fcan01_04029 [Folsomia candida]
MGATNYMHYIHCYKSRRKSTSSEETERLRDELLRNKILPRRKSTSLTSPPFSDSVVNPNYNASPYKVPTRHLRSTSATYSPTHYLSPHHRRNSTPTQVASACSCCGAPRGISKSKSSASAEHSITPSLSSSTPPAGPPETINCCCNSKSPDGNDFHHQDDWEDNTDFLSTHKCRLIPINAKSRPKSKLIFDNSDEYRHQNQKSFSFGPIPAARKARCATGQANSQKSPACNITFTTPTFTITQTNLNTKDCPDWEERQPLLAGKKVKEDPQKVEKVEGFSQEKSDDNDYEKADDDSLTNWKTCPNNKKGRTNKLDLLKKENMVMEEIPYYVENLGVAECN